MVIMICKTKKIINLKPGTDPNDAIVKSQISLLEGVQPGIVANNKAIIYSNAGSVHTYGLYIKDEQDTPDSDDVHVFAERQNYNNIRLHIPALPFWNGKNGIKKDSVITSIEQTITGKKVLEILKYRIRLLMKKPPIKAMLIQTS